MNKIKRDDGKNTCLTDCVARYFNLDPKTVPFFIGYKKNWIGRLKRFFKERGYTLTFHNFDKKFLKNKRKLYLVSGLSTRSKAKFKNRRRGLQHAVLYRGETPYFDPASGKKFLRYPLFFYEARKIKK